MKKHDITLKAEVTDDFLSDIMITAFDATYGGAWYWCKPNRRKEPWLTTNGAAEASETVWYKVEILECEDVNDPDAVEWTVDFDVLKKGIHLMLDKAMSEHLYTAVVEQDCSNIDAEIAEMVVQCGLFDGIIYG